MGWLITLAVLLLIAAVPVGVSAKYDADGLIVRVIAGFIRFTVFPFPKKKKAPAKSGNQKEKTAKPVSSGSAPSQSRNGGSITDFLPLVKIAFQFLGAFRRKLRVDNFMLILILASDDPCDLAMNYGRTWAAVNSFLPSLERFITIKKRNIEVECDFVGSETKVVAQIDLTITIGRILYLGIVYGFLMIREFLKIKKKRKGGVPA